MLLWILLDAGILGILLFFILMNILNVKKTPRLELFPDAGPKPPVSVIVPARNEERNIARCVSSLLGQDYPDLEIIVVDDGSTDATRSILEGLRGEDARLAVVDGLPLPKGWAGKNWACSQGAETARGALLVFTDADTRHAPNAVTKAVSAFLSTKADFMTALTDQETRSIGEKSIVPVVFWIMYSLFPFALMNRYGSLPLSFGNGQFIMMSRAAYGKTGGHAAVRGAVIEDMTLARLVRRRGMRAIVVDGSRYVSCRMYTNAREIFEGFGKIIYLLFRQSLPKSVAVPAFLGGLGLLWMTFIGPLASLLVSALLLVLGIAVPQAVVALTVLGLLFSVATFCIVYFRFNYPVHMILLYPLNVLAFLCVAFASLVLTSLGKTKWKGRALEIDGI